MASSLLLYEWQGVGNMLYCPLTWRGGPIYKLGHRVSGVR